MKEESLEVFVDGLTNYFDKTTSSTAKVSTPFLIGNHKGSVFFTAPRIMIVKLISEIGVLTTKEEKLMDLVGEISNTISGNARRTFGDQFMLSTPVVLRGKGEQLHVPDITSIYVIPVVWKNMSAHLIINLNQE